MDKIDFKNLNLFDLYKFKNDHDILSILPSKNNITCKNILNFLVNNEKNLLDTYYNSLLKYNEGVKKDDIIEYNNIKLWKKTIENFYFVLKIFKYLKKININEKIIKIYEIGCGFCDIYLFLNKLCLDNNIKIQYNIIDLDDWNTIIKIYLKKINSYGNNLEFINYSDIRDNNIIINNFDLLISKYAYSELNGHLRKLYLDRVVTYAKYVYIIWNYCWSAMKEHGIDHNFRTGEYY